MQNFGALSPPKFYEHLRGPQNPKSLGDFLINEGHLVPFGAVYVNHRRILDPQFIVSSQDVLRIHRVPRRYDVQVEEIKERIVFENHDFLIVDKPSGLPMHPTLDNYRENLVKALEEIKGHRLFVTHRLDVPTSGLVLIAKTASYQTYFNNLMMNREVEKFYEAQTLKPVPLGLLRHWMVKSKTAPKHLILQKPEFEEEKNLGNFDECLLEVLLCTPNPDPVYLSKIKLLTGRTHQIRAQLSTIGTPIIGDEMYGGTPSPHFGLRATSLIFCDRDSQKKISISLNLDHQR